MTPASVYLTVCLCASRAGRFKARCVAVSEHRDEEDDDDAQGAADADAQMVQKEIRTDPRARTHQAL